MTRTALVVTVAALAGCGAATDGGQTVPDAQLTDVAAVAANTPTHYHPFGPRSTNPWWRYWHPAPAPTPPPPTTAPAPPAPAPVAPAPVAPAPVAPAPVAAVPSGNGAPASWQGSPRTFFDDFTGSSLDTHSWGVYNGRPSNNTVSVWSPSMVSVSNGSLWLRSAQVNGQWTTAGVSNAVAGSQAYGTWLVRYRADRAAGVNYVGLLYPAGGGWPPEIDFAEDLGGGDRSAIMGVTHWSSANQQVVKIAKSDFSQWHTLGVTITPTRVSYLLDGQPWATVDGQASAPSVPMWLGLQTQVNSCAPGTTGCVNSSTPSASNVQVDWVARYR